MGTRTHRLTTKQFNAVFKNGVVLRSPHFLVRVVRPTATVARAIVVSKKVASGAVQRNTLKRKVSACIARCVSNNTIPNGEYIFFVMKRTLPHHDSMCDEIAHMCAR